MTRLSFVVREPDGDTDPPGQFIPKENMAFIKQVTIEEASGETARLYQAAIGRAGGVANIIRVMSQDGKSASASMGFYISLMKTRNSLSGAQREMLAAVVSNTNDCFY